MSHSAGDSWPARLQRFLWRRHRLVLAALLIVHAALLAWSSLVHSPAIDEPAHLAAGLSHWRFGDFTLYRVNPPLVRLVATAPLLLTKITENWDQFTEGVLERREHSIGDDLVEANGSRIFGYTTLARLACIPFSLVGAIACYAWGRMLFGRVAGLAAAALWCLAPTVLGHGSLITPDAAGAATGMAACLVFTRWLVAPSWRWAIFAGMMFGIAESCKSTWIILFPLVPLIWGLWRVSSVGAGRQPRQSQLATILALAWGFLLGTYGFSGVFTSLGKIPFRSELFTTVLCQRDDNGQATVRPWLAGIPVPLPADYVVGLDEQYYDLERPNRNYLRGVWRTEGWWYYYLYGIGVKETAGALVMAALSLLLWAVTLARRRSAQTISNLRRRHLAASLLVAICPLTVLAVASANTAMNHHVRYMMPVVPFLYVLGAGIFSRGLPWPLARHVVGGLLLAWASLSSLLVLPHSLSYFNEFAGGPRGGVYHLNNSNIDWGQDLLLLRDWQRQHAPDETIHLAYFGRVNPIYAGIQYRVSPQWSNGQALSPGWYAVSVTLLQGRAYVVHSPENRSVPCAENAFGYFRDMEPVDRVGYSIYIYRVTSPTDAPR
jgi:hypothetical protein